MAKIKFKSAGLCSVCVVDPNDKRYALTWISKSEYTIYRYGSHGLPDIQGMVRKIKVACIGREALIPAFEQTHIRSHYAEEEYRKDYLEWSSPCPPLFCGHWQDFTPDSMFDDKPYGGHGGWTPHVVKYRKGNRIYLRDAIASDIPEHMYTGKEILQTWLDDSQIQNADGTWPAPDTYKGCLEIPVGDLGETPISVHCSSQIK